MGYFANGSENMDYEAEYCFKCVHSGQDDMCPVMFAHFLYNDHPDSESKPDVKFILNLLIPRSGVHNEQCKMFSPVDK
jgi:hypothetical protein